MTYTQPPQEQAFDDFLRPQTNLVHAFTVTAYGARGDKSIDSTNAFQAALNACSTDTPTGKTGDVYVPFGSYLCGALSIPTGVRLIFANGATLVAPATLATDWIKLANVVHQGTTVENGTFDATAVTSTSCTAVLYWGATSVNNVRVLRNRIINAPVHGIFVTEGTKTQTKKWVIGNSVEGHGIAGTGFGIYADYVGGIEIAQNYCTNTGGNDCIELGHSGIGNLGVNGHMRCVNNTCKGGPINFPFSDGAEILGNTVLGLGIWNDTNTANGVVIAHNTILSAAPASGYAGIRVAGADAIIVGNHVDVTQNDGIAGQAGSFVRSLVANNHITSSSGANAGAGIRDGTSGTPSDNTFIGNVIAGTVAQSFASAFVSIGTREQFVGNIVNGICNNGINDSGTNNSFLDNSISTFSGAVAAAGTGAVVRNNNGINPVGVLTPPVPGSGSAVPASYVDRSFYITTGAGATTVAISNGPTITLAASTAGQHVLVPAGQTLTPTYANAPTWVVEGL